MYEEELKDFKDWHYWKCPDPKVYKHKTLGLFDDNIFTLDIETVSLFEDENGDFKPFDYSKDAEWYKTHEKVCCPYLWQFGSEFQYFYGRDLNDFEIILKELADPDITKFIYIHNSEYETQFLLDIICRNHWTISETCARQKRQPIQYKINEINIVIRCSYQLTNLSLANSAKKFTDLKKAVGELDYSIPYSPLSKLPENAMYYALMDVKTLSHIIEHFRSKYGHIKRIPLTQTGTVRRAIQKDCGYWYIRKQWDKVPPYQIYLALMAAYTGGICHGNILYLNQTIKSYTHGRIWSYDFSSSYPYIMTCFKLPLCPFRQICEEQEKMYKKNDTHAILYHVRFKNVKSKYWNHFIPIYKMAKVEDRDKLIIDNGRLSKYEGTFEMFLTDYDFDMIKQTYYIEETEVIRMWASYKDYLEPEMVDFIITKYANKTKLKGVTSEDGSIEAFYQSEKEQINCMYGISCQNVLKQGIEFHPENEGKLDKFGLPLDIWSINGLTQEGELEEDFAKEKLDDMKSSFSTLFFPMACGCWITSIAKCNLFKNVIKLDKNVLYYDTDSIKGFGDGVEAVVDEYNKEVEERIKASAEANNIDIEKYKPLDVNGVCHPIGYFDNETFNHKTGKDEPYLAFKTIGAKKYMYQTADGKNHLTMSGVRKQAVKALGFNTFRTGTEIGYRDADKLLRLYEDNQKPFTYTDVDGNIYKCTWRHTIILQPTTFKIGYTEYLHALQAQEDGFIIDYI